MTSKPGPMLAEDDGVLITNVSLVMAGGQAV